MEALYRFVFTFLFVALITKEAFAAQHTVGGSQGWDESTDYESWASGQTFKVDNQLVFKYSGLHRVMELGGESAYKSCEIGSALNSMNDGNSVVKLGKPSTRYFACGTLGHCDQVMKVKITTVVTDSSSSTPSGSSTSSTPAVSASAASAFLSNNFFLMAALLLSFYLLSIML